MALAGRGAAAGARVRAHAAGAIDVSGEEADAVLGSGRAQDPAEVIVRADFAGACVQGEHGIGAGGEVQPDRGVDSLGERASLGVANNERDVERQLAVIAASA